MEKEVYSTDSKKHLYNNYLREMLETSRKNNIKEKIVFDFLNNKCDILFCGKYEQWIRTNSTVVKADKIIKNFWYYTSNGNENVLSDILKSLSFEDISIIKTNYYDRYTCK